MSFDAETIAIGGDVVGRDKIVNHIQNIFERALGASEEAEQARTLEARHLAHGIGQLARRLQSIAGDTRDAARGGPYKGLLEYRLSDAEIFFGRERAIRDLLACLGRGRLTVLHSESGAGKTSLLQAGISAHLIAAGHLPLYLRPYNTSPSSAIKRAFVADPGLIPALDAAPLRECLRQVYGVLGPQTALFILLDQFEEFFTLLDEPDRDAFVRELVECLDDDSLNVRWVLALRTESFGNLAGFRPRIRNPFENDFRLNRLTRDEAARVVAEPASRQAVTFEAGLIDTLLDDLGRNEIAPPQLQLVCAALFDSLPEGERTITRAAYDSYGGAAGILRGYLEQVLSRDLPPQARTPARRLLESLISSEQQRIIRPYAELIAEMGAHDVTPDTLDVILSQLVDSRLLRVTEMETGLAYELAHDYLVSEIRLDPDVQARKAAQELLEQETRAYRRHRTLLSEDRLKVIEPYRAALHFTPEAEALFDASRNAIRQARLARERLRNVLVIGSIAVAVIMALLAVFGLNSSAEAQNQTATAQAETRRAESAEGVARAAERLARVRELAAQGQAQFEDDPLLGLRLALEAWALAPAENTATRDSIERVIRNLAATGRVLKVGDDVRHVYASPDAQLLVFDRARAGAEIYRMADGERLDLDPGDRPITNVFFSPDPEAGVFVVTFDLSTVKGILTFDEMRNTADGSFVSILPTGYNGVDKVYFDPGRGAPGFVVSYAGASSELRHTVDGSLVQPLSGSVVSVTYSLDPAASVFVVSYAGKSGELRRTADGVIVETLADEVESVRFSPAPASAYFLVRYKQAGAEVRRSADGAIVATLGSGVDNVYFSPRPNTPYFIVKYVNAPGRARRPGELWHTAGGPPEPLTGAVVRALFSHNSNAEHFIVYYSDAPGEVRRVGDGSVAMALTARVQFAEFSPDPAGAYFTVIYSDTHVADEVRRTADGRVAVTFTEQVGEVDFSLDAAVMVVDYSSPRVSDAVLNTADGSPLATLGGEVVNVYFSPDAEHVYMVLDYEGASGAVHRVRTGFLATSLTGEVDKLAFSADGAYFVVSYVNGRSEAWLMRPGAVRLLDLGLGRAEYAIDLNRQHMLVRYSDSRAYLIDLAWLQAMGGNPATLPIEDLIPIACRGPLASALFDEAALQLYLNDQPSQACR